MRTRQCAQPLKILRRFPRKPYFWSLAICMIRCWLDRSTITLAKSLTSHAMLLKSSGEAVLRFTCQLLPGEK